MKNEQIEKWQTDKYFKCSCGNILEPLDHVMEKDLEKIESGFKTTTLPCTPALFKDTDELIGEYFSDGEKSIKKKYCNEDVYSYGKTDLTFQIPKEVDEVIEAKINEWSKDGEFVFAHGMERENSTTLLPELRKRNENNTYTRIPFSALLDDLRDALKDMSIPVTITQVVETYTPAVIDYSKDIFDPPEYDEKELDPIKVDIPCSDVFEDGFRYQFLEDDDYDEMKSTIDNSKDIDFTK